MTESAERRPPSAERAGENRRLGRLRRRWRLWLSVVVLVALLLPIPWRHTNEGVGVATAWRLDGRLEVEGRPVDPPGRWTWLAVGRPQLVGEALWHAATRSDDPARDMRRGLLTRSPALTEPAAAAVGLRAAGHDVPLRLIVEARDPIAPGYPQRAMIVTIDGLEVSDRQAWEQAISGWEVEAGVPTSAEAGRTAFSLPDGRRFTAPGVGLPYRVVNTLDVAPVDLEAGISFKLLRWLPGDWLRNLSLGSSHGAMVALTTYADASGRDLAQGRHIAGTGGIRGDGVITRIGGLPAKAKAAKRAGADVLLFPASQAHELEDEDLGGMALVPVRTLEEAIAWLLQPVA